MKRKYTYNRNHVKGIKLVLLTIVLQSTVLGFALVLKAKDLLPADFVNYSGRLTSQDKPEDVLVQKAAYKKQLKKAAAAAANSQKETSQDESSSEN